MSVLRAAQQDDAGVLAELHVAAWQAAYRGLMPDDYLDSVTVEGRVRSWRQLLGAGAQVLLAAQGERIVGFVSYGLSRDQDAAREVGEVYAIYVHPLAWGTGVGTALHDGAVTAFSDLGVSQATLWVLNSNERARGFYVRRGWWSDGGAKRDERPGATLMEVRYRRQVHDGRGR